MHPDRMDPPLRAILLAAIPAALLLGEPVAGSAQAWYGLTPPMGLELPPQLAVVEDSGFASVTAAMVPGGEAFVELEGERIRDLLYAVVTFSEQSHARGERMWGRVSGFPAAAATAEWVAEQFRSAGLRQVEVQRYDSDAPMWWPDNWEVRILGNDVFGEGSADVVLHSAVPARGTEIPTGTLTAPLVFVGDVGDLRDVDVEGKVAVQRRAPTGGAASQRSVIAEGAAELFARGAVAVLNYIDQPGNMHVRDFSGCASCFNIGGGDGAFVRAVAEHAERDGNLGVLKARLFLEARMRSDLTAQNVIGLVPGETDEIIVINAHMDGWYGASGDNGDGVGVLVALARHFAKPENRPARTLMFVGSGGHHSTGLNGPQRVVSMNPELMNRALLVLNLEHIAQFAVDPESFEVQRTEQSMGWGISNLAPALIELTDRARELYGFRIREEYSSGVPGDLGRYEVLGVPRVQAIHAGPLYHTTGDIPETISVDGLERAARFYRFWIDGVTKLSPGEIDP